MTDRSGQDRAQAGIRQRAGHPPAGGRQLGADGRVPRHARRDGPTSGDVAIDPKPLTVSYQVQLDAIRDEVVDLVALRARLEKRMEARLQGEDLAGVEEGLKEYALLPPRETFAEQLTKLKDEAARQQAESKTAVLTKNIQAQFNELQALIDRYLDDEAFTSYTEALERKRAEKSEKQGQGESRGRRRQAHAPPRLGPCAGTGDRGPRRAPRQHAARKAPPDPRTRPSRGRPILGRAEALGSARRDAGLGLLSARLRASCARLARG